MFRILTSNTHNQRAYKTVVNLITLRLNSIVFVNFTQKTGVIALAWIVLSLTSKKSVYRMIFKSKYVAAHIWLTEFSRNTTLCNKIFQS